MINGIREVGNQACILVSFCIRLRMSEPVNVKAGDIGAERMKIRIR